MRVVTVIGNRPQSVKAAAVSSRLRGEHEEVLVHTGQHYDPELSSVFVQELDLPAADRDLAIGPGTSTQQIAWMLERLGPVLIREKPDVVLVYGDTSSTLAGALAAAQLDIPIAHVEAGMRSFDRHMPEERNRVVTDHLSTLLLCPSELAVRNLTREGITETVEMVGDVMVDVASLIAPLARERTEVLDRWNLVSGEFLLATAHRAGNVDSPERLRALVELLGLLPPPVLLALHPRTRRRLSEENLLQRLADSGGVILAPPLGYLDFAALLVHARAVVTDSGGAQKEAYQAGVRCLTLRDRTEWPETVDAGWNTLVDLDPRAAVRALEAPLPAEHPELYGDGRAGERVVAALTAMTAR